MPLIALLLLVLLVPAQTALAGHVECGSVITTDTTLDSDIVCEGETYNVTAITVAADNVTLDLAGHTVSGEPAYGGTSNGIATDGARTGITIRGGTVRGFGAGVNLLGSHSVIERTMSLDNGGVSFSVRGDDNLVLRSTADHTGEFGIYVRGDRVTLDRNHVRGMITCATVEGNGPRITRNTFADCYWAGGIAKYTSALVARNIVTGNSDGYSVVLGQGARVERNLFEGNAFEGLFVVDQHAVIDRNIANGNSYEPSEHALGGIVVRSPGTVVRRNIANSNGDYGILAVPGVVDGGGNRARDNGNALQCLNVACRR